MRLKTLLLTVVLAVGLNAETVYLSANGKTFHKTASCMALHRSTHVLSAERAAAEAHGLHQCGICYREHSNKAKEGKNAGWASEMAKPEVTK